MKGPFLKLRNCESQFRGWNQFFYLMKTHKWMEWQAFRNGNWPFSQADSNQLTNPVQLEMGHSVQLHLCSFRKPSSSNFVEWSFVVWRCLKGPFLMKWPIMWNFFPLESFPEATEVDRALSFQTVYRPQQRGCGSNLWGQPTNLRQRLFQHFPITLSDATAACLPAQFEGQ